MEKRNIGSSFNRWLRAEGIRKEVTTTAIKRMRARQVEAAMKKFSEVDVRRRMRTGGSL